MTLEKIRLEKGETYPLYIQNPIILFSIEEGSTLSLGGEKKKILGKEEMIILPQEISYLLSSEEMLEFYIFSISDPSYFFFRYISDSYGKRGTLSEELFHTLTIHSLVQKFIQSIMTYQRDQMLSERLMDIKTAELFTLLKLLYTKEELMKFFAPVLDSGNYFRMIVLSSYKKVKTVAEFSEISGLSVSSFSRLFHKVFGISPYKWMIQQRIKSLSLAITHSSQPLKQIAYENGFSSLSQMIDFCKKHTGKTPGEIRNKLIERNRELIE